MENIPEKVTCESTGVTIETAIARKWSKEIKECVERARDIFLGMRTDFKTTQDKMGIIFDINTNMWAKYERKVKEAMPSLALLLAMRKILKQLGQGNGNNI